MPLAYVPPGVNVEELYSPSVNPLLSVSASVCLVGLARGYEVGVGQAVFLPNADETQNEITLTAPEGGVFSRVDVNNVFVSAVNPIDPTAGSGDNQSGYIEGTDFTTDISEDGKTITVTTVEDSALDTDGGTVRFTYRFVAEQYYDAVRLDTSSAVEARFGPAFDTNGIVTPLSAAAALAFENGAASVVIQPLFKVVGGERTQPTAAEAADPANWTETLTSLRDIEDINIIVPIIGQSDDSVGDATQLSILERVQDHAYYMFTQGQYIVGIFGEDSSASADDATLATIRNHAGILRDRYGSQVAEQTVLISPSRFTRVLPSNNNRSITVGGQYVAAAVAGMVAARPVMSPLTRKQISGFSSVSFPNHDKASKDADAQAGLFVIEQKGLAVQVRHSITLDTSSTARRELSVVRAKHRLIESVRTTLDTQIIGQVPADGQAPMVVKNAVISVLEDLRQRREIVDYSGVQARVLANDPTTVECRFSYRPAFPLNYVQITFSLDLTAGDITTTFGTLAV